MKQSDIILKTEGDAWYQRNKASLGNDDKVIPLLNELNIRPTSVMEVGCCTGWRLERMREEYGCDVYGVEPSMEASVIARRNGINVWRYTADKLPYGLTKGVDMLIFGFCLYLADPEDLARIVAEADRVLDTEGHLVIHDFLPEPGVYAVRNVHDKRLLCYHFDFAKLWLASPLYSLVARRVGPSPINQVTILKKLRAESIKVET